MIKLEFVEERLLLNGVEYISGDVKSLPDALAQVCIENGWARNVETGEIGERKPGSVKINVDNINAGQLTA